MNPALYNQPGEWTSVRAGRREWYLEDLFRCLAPYRRRSYEPLLSPIAQTITIVTIAIAQEKRYLLQGGHGWSGVGSWLQGAEQYILADPDACLAHIQEKLLPLQGEERATLRSRTMTLLEVYALGPRLRCSTPGTRCLSPTSGKPFRRFRVLFPADSLLSGGTGDFGLLGSTRREAQSPGEVQPPGA
jgi:hypothetical protein